MANAARIVLTGVALTGALALLLALPAAALEDILARPAACEPLLTVHKGDCSVEIVLRCEPPEGSYLRHEEYDGGALDSVSHTGMNGDLVQHSDAVDSFHVELLTGQPKPSPGAIVDAGSVRIEQEYLLTILGITRLARLTESIHADEVPFRIGDGTLQRFPADVVLALPSPMPTVKGTTTYYFDAATGALFEGESYLEVFDDSNPDVPAVPVRLIRKGEPDFSSSEPDPDCDSISAIPSERTSWPV